MCPVLQGVVPRSVPRVCRPLHAAPHRAGTNGQTDRFVYRSTALGRPADRTESGPPRPDPVTSRHPGQTTRRQTRAGRTAAEVYTSRAERNVGTCTCILHTVNIFGIPYRYRLADFVASAGRFHCQRSIRLLLLGIFVEIIVFVWYFRSHSGENYGYALGGVNRESRLHWSGSGQAAWVQVGWLFLKLMQR